MFCLFIQGVKLLLKEIQDLGHAFSTMVEDGKDGLAPVDREDRLEHGPVEVMDSRFELLCKLL